MVQRKQNWAKALTAALNLATSVGAVIAIGLFGGKWLDARFDTGNLYTILGFALGVASAMKMLWDNLMKEDRKKALPEEYGKKEESDS